MALLGIECGASSSRAILEWEEKQEIVHFEAANFRLCGSEKLGNILTGLREKLKGRFPSSVSVQKVAIGLPGVLTEDDRAVSYPEKLFLLKFGAYSSLWNLCFDFSPHFMSFLGSQIASRKSLARLAKCVGGK